MAEVGVEKISLEFTPSWVVALVCFSIVLISLTVEGFLRCTGKLSEKYKMWALARALGKIKEELMVLGFISLLLAVFQTRIGKICISNRLATVWLPCKKPDYSSTVASFTTSPFASGRTQGRRLLAGASNATDYCSQMGKVPLLSVEALHHLDIFIFVLATFHVVLCALKVLLGYAKIREWRRLEKSGAGSTNYDHLQVLFKEKLKTLTSNRVQRFFTDLGNKSAILGWVISFFKQFYPSVTQFEYVALRLNFKVAHDLEDPKEDFQNYIIEAVQNDFQKMIGISWYLWLCAVIFLLVNVAGWHAYFWISFVPLTLLLVVGTNLEYMITRLAREVAEKHSQDEKNPVDFSNDDFPFHCPSLFRILIHIVLFENSLEIAFFFFILFQYNFHSCVMGKVGFVVTRIALGVFVQFMCIYRIIPLYAIMKSQMQTKEKRPDKLKEMCSDLEDIKTRYKDQSDKRTKRFFDDLDEVKLRLKGNRRDEEEEMWIVTRVSKLIDNRRSTRFSKVDTDAESNRAGPGEGSVGAEMMEPSDVNTTGDIESQKKQPKPAANIQDK